MCCGYFSNLLIKSVGLSNTAVDRNDLRMPEVQKPLWNAKLSAHPGNPEVILLRLHLSPVFAYPVSQRPWKYSKCLGNFSDHSISPRHEGDFFCLGLQTKLFFEVTAMHFIFTHMDFVQEN